MSDGFSGAYDANGGDDWRSTTGFPPMVYSTRSARAILSISGAQATSVTFTCLPDTANGSVKTL